MGVLSQLNQPQYGYSLVTILKEKGIQIEPRITIPTPEKIGKASAF